MSGFLFTILYNSLVLYMVSIYFDSNLFNIHVHLGILMMEEI